MTTEKIQSEYNIPLGNGNFATVNLVDFDKVADRPWHVWKTKSPVRYACSVVSKNGKRNKRVYLHCLIAGDAPSGMEIGHKDGNGLNCRRDNLLFLTPQQNTQGKQTKRIGATSSFRGVCWAKQRKLWKASVTFNGEKFNLGFFATEIEAAKAYDAGARKYFGEHAAPNFP